MDVAAARLTGLGGQEAAARLRDEGYNELPAGNRRTLLRILIGIIGEPMFALLLGAAAVYLALGDLTEAVVLVAFATSSVSIALIQETRTERILESLRDLTSPRALVIRDGVERRIPGREVVRGDIVVLAEGDRVPADAVLLSGHDLRADESLLTGESVPVGKLASAPGASAAAPARPGGEDLPHVFSGSLIVRGRGLARVTATGQRSEIGKIGLAIARLETEPPRLRLQTRRLVLRFAILSLATSALATVLYGVLRGSWLDALLSGIALS
ncbi:MAG TPA: cation-transporting P-type ATPase, partial [Stellaceae bacterium]|nr:cation-transporting P-type ATPase [Stellaceae bacterium]